MGALSPMHLILILGIAILILGPKRLPEAGEALGRALREFRDAVGEGGATGTSTSAAATNPGVGPAPVAPVPPDAAPITAAPIDPAPGTTDQPMT